MKATAANLFFATLALALTAAPLAAWPAEHGHDHAAASKAAAAPQGRKWATDAPLRQGMARIRALVQPQLVSAHAGGLDAAQYRALASGLEAEVGQIVANCKLPADADASLHGVLAEIGAGVDAMAGRPAQAQPAEGLHRVALALNDYARNFNDPAFRPIAGLKK